MKLERTIQEETRKPGFLQRLRNKTGVAVGTAVLASLPGGLLGARNLSAAEPADAKIITVVPFKGGNGLNGSKWYGGVRIDNTSATATADGTVYVLPQQNNVLASAPQFAYSIPPHQSLIIDNLSDYFTSIGDPQPNLGNVSLKVVPSDEVEVGVLATIRNVQNLAEDNEFIQYEGNTNVTTTDLMQGLPGVNETRLLEPGDYVTMAAPSVQLQEHSDPVETKAMHRMNVFFYGEQDSQGRDPELLCELYRADGAFDSSRWIDLNTNGGTQIVNFIENGMERKPTGDESIRCVVMNGTAWIMPSVTKNNVDLPGVDDGYTTEPAITRLVEEEVFVSAPSELEVNDQAAIHAHVKSRPGTEVLVGTFGGAVATSVNGDGTNEYTWTYTEPIKAAGTATNTFTYTVKDEQGNHHVRNAPNHTLEVVAERDYVLGDEAIQPTIDNKEEIALLLSKPNVLYTATMDPERVSYEDALELLEGMTNPNDPSGYVDMNGVTLRDTVEGNPIAFQLENGSAQSFSGFTEWQMNQLLEYYGEKQ